MQHADDQNTVAGFLEINDMAAAAEESVALADVITRRRPLRASASDAKAIVSESI